MILICDAGTTGCDWILLDDVGDQTIGRYHMPGINPTYHSSEEIRRVIHESEILQTAFNVREIYFFGSGCGTEISQSKLKVVLTEIFPYASTVRVKGDMDAAVYATSDGPCVVGILGTGSNICYYDGREIHYKIPSLGYHIMDQGSGNAIGRKLLRSYYFDLMPEAIMKDFSNAFDLEIDLVKNRLYKSDQVSRYLAGFAPFLFERLDHPFLESLLRACIIEYFDTSVKAYAQELYEVPLCLVGSIAALSANVISEICDERGITQGSIVAKPLDRLGERISLFRNK